MTDTKHTKEHPAADTLMSAMVRMNECVNALEGIRNPAQFMDDVRELVQLVKEDHCNESAVDCAQYVENHMKGGDQ